jgi:hypothetical protein
LGDSLGGGGGAHFRGLALGTCFRNSLWETRFGGFALGDWHLGTSFCNYSLWELLALGTTRFGNYLLRELLALGSRFGNSLWELALGTRFGGLTSVDSLWELVLRTCIGKYWYDLLTLLRAQRFLRTPMLYSMLRYSDATFTLL